MASPILPADIITNILSRLPSKTLIRFKSVSKQWYSLINSPHFINLHLSQTLISQNSPNFILSQHSIFSVAISDEDDPNFYLSELDHPLKQLCETQNSSGNNVKQFLQILGSINGVVCISTDDKSSVVLYNPSTKTHRFIPPFTPSPNTNPRFEISVEGAITITCVVFGFRFDSVSGDYKLLRMIDTRTTIINSSVYREASVYSLRNDSWKCVSDQIMTGQSIYRISRFVLVNEVLHFIGVDSNFIHNVQCFNLRNETFSIFDLPKLDESYVNMKSYLIQELGGYLSVLVNYHRVTSEMELTLAKADLWVMKDYGNEESWFRLFSISNPSSLGALTHLKPIVYSRDKDRVLLELDCFSFGWYSWGSQRFERITVHGLLSTLCDLCTFMDSLVSLGKDKEKDTEKGKDKSEAVIALEKSKNKDDFLSSGF